jgi:hypothetical protein
MSIIVAVASTRNGGVASDGRRFAPAWLENGCVVRPAAIESEVFDKTLTLDGNKIVGAFCGLMSFSGQSIAEHITEIVSPPIPSGAQFAPVVENIAGEVARRLNCVADREVTFPCRKLDLLLVAGESLTRSGLCIASIRVHPVNGAIKADTGIVRADSSNRYWIYGDDRAVSAARTVFEANHAPNRDAGFLKRLAGQAVQAGIAAAGPHPHGSDPACGGQVFLRRTWYA